MKKLSVILLGTLLCICLALLPTEVQAATEGYLTYVITDGEVTITDCDEDAKGKIVIPDTIGGYPVTKIVEFAFSECNELSEITIPASVTHIPDGAFRATRGLTGIWVADDNPVYASDSKGVLYSKDMKKVLGAPLKLEGTYTVADGANVISRFAFFNCASITEVCMPETLNKIDDYTFCHCENLETINIPKSVQYVGKSAFYRCISLREIVIPEGITTIKQETFWECSALITAHLPDTITAIEFAAFEGCTSLKTIDISHVTTIEEMAFDGCRSLDNITLAEGLTIIADSAFRGCYSLTSIQIPSTVTEIGFHAFWNCTSLKEIYIPAGVVKLADAPITQNGVWVAEDNPNYVSDSKGVLYSKDMTVLYGAPHNLSGHYTIPNGVVEIKLYAFTGCKGLTGVDVPDSLTTIGSYAFSYSGLTEVPAFKKVTTLDGTFRGCTGLVSVTVPEGVQEIGTYAFEDCTSLTTVRLPSSIKKIGMHAFQDCTALKEVFSYVSKGAIEIDDSVKTNDYLLKAEWVVHECTWEEVVNIEPTCERKEYICTECGKTKTEWGYAHDIEETWNADAQNHWQACKKCGYKQSWLGHNRGPAATEDAPQVCTVCGYEITPKLQKEEPKKEEPTYWIWIVVGAVILAGGATATVIILKKKRQ